MTKEVNIKDVGVGETVSIHNDLYTVHPTKDLTCTDCHFENYSSCGFIPYDCFYKIFKLKLEESNYA